MTTTLEKHAVILRWLQSKLSNLPCFNLSCKAGNISSINVAFGWDLIPQYYRCRCITFLIVLFVTQPNLFLPLCVLYRPLPHINQENV